MRLLSTLQLTSPINWSAYYRLCKPRVVGLITFTAVVGMLLAGPDWGMAAQLVVATLGIACAAASAAAINHLADRRIDARMQRTHRRPLPTGSVSPFGAGVLAAALGLGGMGLLHFWVNPLTALLTLAAFFGYAIFYTLYLKWWTPQNIVIAGSAGAAPPLIGWVAATGQVSGEALLLFLIIYTWTPPHFWALALYRQSDYARAEVPMLPVTHGPEFTRLMVLLYTVLLAIVTILPVLTGMSGWIYLAAAVPLNLRFLHWAWRLYRGNDLKLGLQTFKFSLVYLAGLFGALLADRLIPL